MTRFAVAPEQLPAWAGGAAKGLGYAGMGLTLFATGVDQWDQDNAEHPNWSTTHKVINTAQTTAVVGGHIGSDVGHGLEDAGKGVAHAASHVWHDIF